MIKVGHYTRPEQGTGVSVFLCEKRAKANFFICGSSPATRELAILQEGRDGLIDALVFTGGSAYGLGATNGVMEWLKERHRGYNPIADILVPIVPTAAIFDLATKQFCYPSVVDAYQACENATDQDTACGQIGAGCGATVGKWRGFSHHAPGGFGVATLRHDDLWLKSYVVVNSVGNVIDQHGKIIAGDHHLPTALNEFPDVVRSTSLATSNTTLVALFTNANLDRQQLYALAKMASAGIARAIYPAFTPYDGDMVFAVSLGEASKHSAAFIGHLAAVTTQQAIINAVTSVQRQFLN